MPSSTETTRPSLDTLAQVKGRVITPEDPTYDQARVDVAVFYQGKADRDVRRSWVTAFARTLQPNDASAYVGFLTDDGEARIRAAYPGSTWDRLTNVKSIYDPTNLFRLNQNIPPKA